MVKLNLILNTSSNLVEFQINFKFRIMKTEKEEGCLERTLGCLINGVILIFLILITLAGC